MTGLKTNTKDLSKSFQKAKLIEALGKCTHNSVLGYAIREGVKNPSEWDCFIADIKSQGFDNPALLERVIGPHAFNLLFNY